MLEHPDALYFCNLCRRETWHQSLWSHLLVAWNEKDSFINLERPRPPEAEDEPALTETWQAWQCRGCDQILITVIDEAYWMEPAERVITFLPERDKEVIPSKVYKNLS